MKKILPLFFIFLYYVLSSFGQDGLKYWKPVGGISFSDVAFADRHRGIAVGGSWYNGIALKTSDGGESWNKLPLDADEPFETVRFTDKRHGWMASSTKILRTSDVGETWQVVLDSVYGKPSSYFFIDSLTAFIHRYNDNGIIYKTTNGGISWESLGTPLPGIRWIDALHFQDQLHGWGIGTAVTDSSHIFRTSDGGLTWTSVNKKNSWSSYNDWIHFIDLQNGWTNFFGPNIDTLSVLGRTSDGGITWTFQSFTDTMGYHYLNDIHFISPDTGFLLGDRSIYKTTDSGNHWEKFHTSSDSANMNGPSFLRFDFADNQTCFVVGNSNLIMKTGNGGNSWKDISRYPTSSGISVWPVDSLTVFTTGEKGLIGKTSDGGSLWTTIQTASKGTFRGIQFSNPATGWTVGDTGTIFKTTDAGITWVVKPSGSVQALRKIEMITPQLGWICGDTGTLLKTTDGGETWQYQSIGSTIDFADIQFLDSLNGWVAGKGGTVFRTTDGGITWQNKNLGQNISISSFHFLDRQNGWVVNGSLNSAYQVWKTSNGGDSWIGITGFYFESSSPAIRFSDLQNGWIVSKMLNTYRTTDGGWTWQRENMGPEPSLYLTSLEMADGKAWASGGEGIVMVRNIPQPSKTPGMVSQITGHVKTNTTGNCLPNPDELLLPNRLVKATPGPFYCNTASDGSYHLTVPVDTLHPMQYTLSVFPPISNNQATPVCPPGNSFSIIIDTLPDTLVGPDFGIKHMNCQNLTVNVCSQVLRPCRKRILSVVYENRGAMPALNAYLMVEFPHWIRPKSATRPHIALNDSTWRINIDTVQNGGIGEIEIIDSVVCGHPEIMGLNQCTKVSIFPIPDCPPPPGWNGASVNTKGVCNQGLIRFSIFNEGTGDMTDSVDYVVMLDSIQAKAGRVKLLMGDSLNLLVNAEGMEATLLVNQVGMHPLSAFLRTTITGCSDTTLHLAGIPDYFPQPQTPVVKLNCQTIRSSWDPNDKQVFPTGFTSRHVVKPGTRLEYRIRFQNTGNDTAFYAMVLDSLDKDLDPESFELEGVSHPHQFEMRTDVHGRTYLRWVFSNLNMPDSNTNEMLSHGFIQYRISPKAGKVPGTVATNQAWIYFDQNPAVLTNPTLTTFDNLVFTDTSLNDNVHVITPTASLKSLRQMGVDVFPNPFSQSVSVRSAYNAALAVSICDVLGRELLTRTFTGLVEMSLVQLPAGVYFLKFPALNRVAKIIKE